jgi:hypothetical protein
MNARSRGILAMLAALAFLLPASCREREAPAPTTPPPPVSKGEPAAGDDRFTGLLLEAAESLAKERGLVPRVVSVDGQPRPATKDYRPDRVNFEVEQGRVVRTSRG